MGCILTLTLRLLTGLVVIILPGQIGVAVDEVLSTERMRVFPPGIYLDPIVGNLVIYPTEPQAYPINDRSRGGDNSIEARTRDGHLVRVSLEVIYRVDVEQVTTLYRRWGMRYKDEFILPISRSSVRDVVATYRGEDLYALSQQLDDARDTAEQAIFNEVSSQFRNEGLLLDDLRIQGIQFSAEFTRIMQARQDAEKRLIAAQTAAAEARKNAESAAQATQTAIAQQTATPTATPTQP
ncbi:MAG: hypothetical protein OHK0023_18620 [Anaerolineae bacterium]